MLFAGFDSKKGPTQLAFTFQGQQYEHWKKEWNKFRVNNKNTRPTSMTYPIVFIVNFKHISHLF